MTIEEHLEKSKFLTFIPGARAGGKGNIHETWKVLRENWWYFWKAVENDRFSIRSIKMIKNQFGIEIFYWNSYCYLKHSNHNVFLAQVLKILP